MLGTSQATVIRRLRELAPVVRRGGSEAAAGPPPHGPRPIVIPIAAATGYWEATRSSRDVAGGRASLGSVVDDGGHLVAVAARHRRMGERGGTVTMATVSVSTRCGWVLPGLADVVANAGCDEALGQFLDRREPFLRRLRGDAR